MVLIDTLATGGAEHVAVDLACGLDPKRFSPHVVVTRSTGPLQRRLDGAGIPVTVLGRRRRISLPAYRRVKRIAEDCDLIHAHKFSNNAWAALLSRTTGKPMIAHEHNWSGTPSRLRSYVNRRWIAPVTSHFLCVSPSVADQLIESHVPPAVVRVLPNGVNLVPPLSRDAARRQLGLSADSFVVGIVARLRPEKNHELLLRAAAALVAKDIQLMICAVGDGPRRAQLELLAADLRITDHVVWAGELNDAARVATAFDVAVLCSEWEGLPLAALEVMSAGVPLIATAVGGLPDLLADGGGVLVPSGGADALADAIETLHGQPAAAARIGAAGQRRVQAQHDSASIVATLEEIYGEVASAAEVAGP